MLAAASPYLASLVRDTAETGQTLSLVGISHAQVTQASDWPAWVTCLSLVHFQALLVVQFMYRGVLERLSEPEIDQVMIIIMMMMIIMIMMMIFVSCWRL